MTWPGPDDRRPLSAKGRAQAERLGAFLAGVGFAPDAILTSPKLRAAETAEIVGAALHARVSIEPGLASLVSLQELDSILTAAANPVRPVLVGHDPDFSDLLGDLVGGGPEGADFGSGLDGLRMRKGAIACIACSRPLRSGSGELRWLIPPDLLER